MFQILQKLMEKLTGEHLAVPEVSQSEEGQRAKLRVVLGFANKVLGINQVPRSVFWVYSDKVKVYRPTFV